MTKYFSIIAYYHSTVNTFKTIIMYFDVILTLVGEEQSLMMIDIAETRAVTLKDTIPPFNWEKRT